MIRDQQVPVTSGSNRSVTEGLEVATLFDFSKNAIHSENIKVTVERNPGKLTREQILEMINSRNYDGLELKDCLGHIAELACNFTFRADFLARKLEKASRSEKDLIFQEIAPKAVELMKNEQMLWLFQLLYQRGKRSQRETLAKMMKGKVAELSVDETGCEVVIQALYMLHANQTHDIVKELESVPLHMMTDDHGSKVIVEIIKRGLVSESMTKFALENAHSLAGHRFGSDVLTALVEFGPEKHAAALREKFLADATKAIEFSCEHSCARLLGRIINTVGNSQDWLEIRRIILDNFLSYSRQLHTVNLVLTVVQFWPKEERSVLVRHIQTQKNLLLDLITDEKGHHVLFRVLFCFDGDDFETLVNFVRIVIASLKDAKDWTPGSDIAIYVGTIEYVIERQSAIHKGTSSLPWTDEASELEIKDETMKPRIDEAVEE
ncbi:armadillo-type protein [Podospora fimiseda]|uniref:Armadillo-type protein n=1 Tax=Podospora fimiseda TaxID=252190 RepID=A0AAN6YLI9_9PEZI|nr:armadillo-type protein [Podospora fimiseda]